MSGVLLSLLCCAGAVDDSQLTSSDRRVRTFFEIDRDMSAFLRREANAKSFQDRAAAIHDIVDLMCELREDPRLAESVTLQRIRGVMRSRLLRVKKRLVAKMKREQRQQQRDAQQLKDGAEPASQVDPVVTGLSDQVSMLASVSGGPLHMFQQMDFARGGGAVDDYGPELVDLIQTVIEPDFWDINGGPGRIYYYRPLRALVITATSEVHHRIGGTLEVLNDVGR